MLTRRHLWLLLLAGSCGFENVYEGADELTVSFEFIESGADEQSGTLMIPVVLSFASDAPVSVTYSLKDSSATPNVDFTITTGTIVFQPGDTRREIPAMIRDDGDENEVVETFNVELSAPVGAVLDERKKIHKVTIANHILPRVTVGPVSTSSVESSPSNLMLFFSAPAEEGSFVVIGVEGGQPAPVNVGADLSVVNDQMVAIPAGAMMVPVPIGEKDDQLDEEDAEIAVFTLRGASTNLVLGTTKVIQHAVLDNDAPPTVSFQNATGTINEGGIGTVAVPRAILSAPSGRTVRVDYVRDANDTADGNDATVFGSPGTVVFAPGDTSEPVGRNGIFEGIFVENDDIDEDGETVIVTLGNPINATLTNATHTLTINDNDTAVVNFAQAGRTVTEGIGTINITVNLSPSAKTVTVPFTIDTDSNVQSDDYDIITPSPLVFGPGVTQLNIQVNVPSSSPGNEGTERLILDLQNPTTGGAVRGGTSEYTLSILED